MSVNSVSSYTSTQTDNYATKTSSQAATEKKTEDVKKEEAAVYESSTKKKGSVTTKSNPKLAAQLKADAEARTQQLRSLVEKMMLKQGQAVQNADSMWKFLASGNYTVDPATARQAQADIADDGYWGVDQTSERIFSFAEALSGGDKEKMQEMLEAFKKGFAQATKAWGKELPDISHRTYDAVMKRFDDYMNDDKDTVE